MPSNHLIFCWPFSFSPQSLPASVSFPFSWHFTSLGQSVGSSASVSVLLMNIQGWFPLGMTGLISFLSRGLSRVFSSTKLESVNFSVLSLLYGPIVTSVHDYWKNHTLTIWTLDSKVMSLFNVLCRFVITFLPKRKFLLISWLQSLSVVILEPKKIKSVSVSTFSPSICHEVMGLEAVILVYPMFSFMPAFSLFHLSQEALYFLFTFCQ